MKQFTEHIFTWQGSVRGGVLCREGHALLIDAPEFPAPVALEETVDAILLTQHRRAHSGGVGNWGAPVWATAGEAGLLENAHCVFTTSHGKYHRYTCLPDRFAPVVPVNVARVLQDGEQIHWRGLTITVVEFAALSQGDCAYLVEDGGQRVLFCGALAMAGGKIHDLYSFQKALPNMMGYHGYLAGLVDWCRGAARVKALAPDLMLSAYGGEETDPAGCLSLLEERLRAYARAYVQGSAVRYYFPEEYREGFERPMGITEPPRVCPTGSHPQWLSRIGETTSYLIAAPSGHGILIDTGDREAVEYVLDRQAQGTLILDACWITHAHDDHLNHSWMLVHESDCELLSTAAVAEVCCQPAAWFLPALPDCNLKLRVMDDGFSWEWEGFRLTSMHLPGQCIAHGGLLVERDGEKVLLCGDSFAPTGLDDYCAENRNLPGKGRGYDRCVKLLRTYGVRQLVNQHQSEPFLYDEAMLVHLEQVMARREVCLAALLPSDIGFGVDPQWLRPWPMEQTVTAHAPLRLSVQVTSHGVHTIRLRPCVPWGEVLPALVHTRELTSGSVMVGDAVCPADQWVHFDLTAPGKGEYQIPWQVWLDDCYLGSYLYCTLQVI